MLGGRIRKFGGDLECRLGAVRTMVDEAPAHRARIAAKRLRYLLEPIRSEVDGVEPLIGKLRELQDALGELRDSRMQRAALVRDLAKAGREHVRRLEAAVHAGVADTPAARTRIPGRACWRWPSGSRSARPRRSRGSARIGWPAPPTASSRR